MLKASKHEASLKMRFPFRETGERPHVENVVDRSEVEVPVTDEANGY